MSVTQFQAMRSSFNKLGESPAMATGRSHTGPRNPVTPNTLLERGQPRMAAPERAHSQGLFKVYLVNN